jgi:hypothetical protein
MKTIPRTASTLVQSVLGLSCLLAASEARSQTLTVSDGNATISVNPDRRANPGGIANWNTDGISSLYEQSWYFRLGDATGQREIPLHVLTLNSSEIVGENEIQLSYNGEDRGFDLAADITYTLLGGPIGSGSSTIDQTATMTNLDTVNPLSLSLFGYSDFDLPNSFSDVASGGVDGITQVNTASFLRTATVTPVSPTPHAFQISEAGDVQTLRNTLGDGLPTELSNATSPFGPADVDFAFQWELEIPVGGSVTISTTQTVAGEVPEPILGPLMQWSAAEGGNEHFYQTVRLSQGISWNDAAAAAKARGGYLATTPSLAENDFVFELVDDPKFWVSLANGTQLHGPLLGGFQPPSSSEPAGDWEWLNGDGEFGSEDAGAFMNWHRGEPNNVFSTGENVLQFFSLGGAPVPSPLWNDIRDFHSSESIAYVIEWNSASDIVPEPTILSLVTSLLAILLIHAGRSVDGRHS